MPSQEDGHCLHISLSVTILSHLLLGFSHYPVAAQFRPPSVLIQLLQQLSGFPGGTSGKEPACQSREMSSNPWVRKIPWRRPWQPTPVFFFFFSPPQYSYLGHPMDRVAWQATVHRVTKSLTRLKQLSTHNKCNNSQ